MIPVLAVDDVPANLHALRLVLKDLPLDLDCVGSAEEGLALLLEKDYAIALIDVQMPGMNGYEMAELMRAHSETEHVPIIFITAGSGRESMVFRGYEVGAVDYLIKPYEPKFLQSKVRVFLELYQARNRMREALQKQEEIGEKLQDANRDLSRFAAIAAHDLRSPLVKSMRMLSMLRAKFGEQVTDEKALRTMDRVEASMRHMSDLVSALYDLYSLVDRELHRHEVRLQTVIEDAQDAVGAQVEETGASFEIGELPTMQADGTLLRQVFQNLFSNALKYSRADVPPVIRVAAIPAAKGEVVIEVADNGEGFDAEEGASLFAPFSRLSETQDREGLGIGLATVQKIIDRHGGHISATGVRGEGATFTIHLPIDAEPD